ncbi:MAG: hypothetical protein LAT76_01420 [Schleiferiaceae bacterium]|nr:hypothetical protein [Schleiferiaceae bacterium]
MKRILFFAMSLLAISAFCQDEYLTIAPSTMTLNGAEQPALELIVAKGNVSEAQKRFTKAIKKASKQKMVANGSQISLQYAVWKKNDIKEPTHIYGDFKADGEGAHVKIALSDTNNSFHDLSQGEIGFRAETFLRRLGIELHQTHLINLNKEEVSQLKSLKKEVDGHEKDISKKQKKIVGAESKIEGFKNDIEITLAEQSRLAEEIKGTDRKMTSLSLSQKEELKLLRKEKSNQESMLKKSRKKTEKLRKNIFKQESKIQDWKNDIKSTEIEKSLSVEKHDAQKEVVDDLATQLDQAKQLLKAIK